MQVFGLIQRDSVSESKWRSWNPSCKTPSYADELIWRSWPVSVHFSSLETITNTQVRLILRSKVRAVFPAGHAPLSITLLLAYSRDLFRLYILFSQYKSCDNIQEDWFFVLLIWKNACKHEYRIYSIKRLPRISAASGTKKLISTAPPMLLPLIFSSSLSWSSRVFFTALISLVIPDLLSV